MCVGVDGEDAAELRCPARSDVREIQSLVGTVDFEGSAGSGRLRKDRVPVQVQVVPGTDLPAGGVGNDVDVRVSNCG